jgi:DNA-binding ferritin-like protein
VGPLKPNQQQLEALVRLRGPEFAQFHTLLEDYEKEVTEQCVTSREPMTVAQAQGGVATIRALKEMIRLAPQLIEKLATKRNTP